MDEATRLQRDRERIRRWRQSKRQTGKQALTIWLPEAQKLYLEDMAIKRQSSPSALVEQALSQVYPGSTDGTVTATDTVTDTSQLRLMLQEELRAFLDRNVPVLDAIHAARHVTVTATDIVTDTVTDTITDVSQVVPPAPVRPRETRPVTAPVTDTTYAYDPAKFVLGRLCPQGHDYQETGQTLRRKHNQSCSACEKERKRQQRSRAHAL